MAEPAAQEAGPTTILHLSDLHVGTQFAPTKWDEICHMAETLRPHLVVVTGDLVESPWRWRLRTARGRLEELRARLRQGTGRADLALVCVPGNHDTRIQGIWPVSWVLPVVLALALAAFLLFEAANVAGRRDVLDAAAHGLRWHAAFAAWRWPLDAAWSLCAALAVAALATRACLAGSLARALGKDFVLTRPTVLPALRLGLLPFDSASHGLSWARGRVMPGDIVASRRAMDIDGLVARGADDDGPFWIALVHHHPLPLPFDDEFESLMVMDNAGAFLAELARRRVRLVLHGHKHHQHFARITVDPASAEPVEVAVLSAGTPTRGRRSLIHRHGFNVLRVWSDHRVHIEMFEAEGDGTFARQQSFDMVQPQEQARLRFEQRRQRLPLSCRRLVCSVDVNEFGDARFVREYRGVRTGDRVEHPDEVVVGASRQGFVEAFRAESLSAHGPGIGVSTSRGALNELSATLEFKTSGLMAGHGAIDFLLEFQSNNAFALDRWQYGEMYGQADFTEFVQFTMPARIALEELAIHLRFANGEPLPKRIDLRWRPTPQSEWTPLPVDLVVRMLRQSALHIQLPFPSPGADYQINWDLDEKAASSADAIGAGRALALRRGLWAAHGADASGSLREDLEGMLAAAAAEVREADERADAEPGYDAALFLYGDDRRLHCVASTYAADDPRRTASFGFGLGIVGRAFKASATVQFVRPHDDARVQPSGYILGDGAVPAGNGAIPEHTIVGFALAPPEAPDWPYAVLQISTDRLDTRLSRLVLNGENDVEILAEAMSQTLTTFLEGILEPPPNAGPVKDFE